jgi:hypothetical protein
LPDSEPENKLSFSNIFLNIQNRGIDYLNDFFPYTRKDLYSVKIETCLLLVCSMCAIMMITSPYGWLYASFPRPPHLLIALMHRIPFNPNAIPTPESGMHYLTVFVYTFFAVRGLSMFDIQKIIKPFHKLSYVAFLTFLTYYTPFEWIYITLMDIFHYIPVYGYPVIWSFGWWREPIDFFFKGILGTDGLISIISILGMVIVKRDLNRYYKTTLKFDKISKLLFVAFILSMVLWVFSPLIFTQLQNHHVTYGTNLFPQTLEVYFGYFKDYNLPLPENGDVYGIIKEVWMPNDIIKYLNHGSKLLSVMFMFYTFTPRRVKDD